jgi:ferrous iron transport protein A
MSGSRRSARFIQPAGQDLAEMGSIELIEAPCNQPLEVKAVRGEFGWDKRFESMGIRKGRRMRKIACQPFGGPVVIEVEGSMISLGRGIAAKIEVEVLPAPSGKN